MQPSFVKVLSHDWMAVKSLEGKYRSKRLICQDYFSLTEGRDGFNAAYSAWIEIAIASRDEVSRNGYRSNLRGRL